VVVAQVLDADPLLAQRLLLRAAVERQDQGDVLVLAALTEDFTDRYVDQAHQRPPAHVGHQEGHPGGPEADPDPAGDRPDGVDRRRLLHGEQDVVEVGAARPAHGHES
jgi:hypothetical protein